MAIKYQASVVVNSGGGSNGNTIVCLIRKLLEDNGISVTVAGASNSGPATVTPEKLESLKETNVIIWERTFDTTQPGPRDRQN